MQALPKDIRNLPKYYVPQQFFICTGIILILFFIWGLIIFFVWVWRSRKHIHNYDYIVDHNIRRQFQHAKKTFKQNMQKQQENEVFDSQTQNSNATQYSPALEQEQMIFNRQQSRLLQFVCLSVVVAININAFVCGIMELITFILAVLLYLVFNVIKVVNNPNPKLGLIFFIPLIVAYIPFFIFKKQIKEF